MFLFVQCMLLLVVVPVVADYDCVCNNGDAKLVYAFPDSNMTNVGLLQNSSCVPYAYGSEPESDFVQIRLHHQISYVELDEDLYRLTCPGNISSEDALYTGILQTTTPYSVYVSHPETEQPGRHNTYSITNGNRKTTLVTIVMTSPTNNKSVSRHTSTSSSALPASVTANGSVALVNFTKTRSSAAPTSPPSRPYTKNTSSTKTITRPSNPHFNTEMSTDTVSSPNMLNATPSAETMPPTSIALPSLIQEANVTGTLLQYIGIGYNLLKGNPYGKSTSSLDPGFLIHRHIFKLTSNGTHVREVINTTSSTCTNQDQAYIITGTTTYQNELLNAVKQSTSAVGNGLTKYAFSLSSEFTDVLHQFQTRNDRVIKDVVHSCKFGTVAYTSPPTNTEHITLSSEFVSDVCKLPLVLNAATIANYVQFFDNWGTNIVKEVGIGTKTVNRYSISFQQLFQQIKQQDSSLIQHMGPSHGYTSSLFVDVNALQLNAMSNRLVGDLISTKVIHSSSQVVPIEVGLIPISDALSYSYWRQVTNDPMFLDMCPENIGAFTIKLIITNINNALEQYCTNKVNGYSIPTDYSIQIPVTWPFGTYGLMEPVSGCPREHTTWETGFVFQDTEDNDANNYFSPDAANFLKGSFDKNNIQTHFCIKTNPVDSVYNYDWPKGSYCILKYRDCPTGFASGWIYWDDEDTNNGNKRGGYLPDGNIDGNTRIYYCCRNDGYTNSQITLPTAHPFVLLSYTSTCQSVYGMNMRTIVVRWDDSDNDNHDAVDGMHPYDEGASGNHLLHFCYYYSYGGNSGPFIG